MTSTTQYQEIHSLRRRVRELEDTLQDLRATPSRPTAAATDAAHCTPREHELLLHAIWSGALDALLITDDWARLIDANPAACELFGVARDALLGRSLANFAAPSFAVEKEWRALIAAGSAKGELPLWRPDGQQRELEFSTTANISPGRHLSVLRDVTERKHLEHQLHQSAKMEALGKLAGGLAHDFNNLLSVILGYGQFALEGLPENAPIRDELRQVLHAGERATALTRQLLALSRTQLASPRVLDLNDAVIRVHRLLRPLLGEDIELIAELSEGLWPVRIDLGQLEQILVNLAINARDAMPSGGKLFFTTSNRVIEASSESEALPPGPYVVLRVRDTGSGIAPEVRAHLFEPFVTTKPPGQGTGLGLATTRCIVRDAGGWISVEHGCGDGTTFCIHLPRAPEDKRASVHPLDSEELRGGDETVLVVEDEPAVLELAVRVLVSRGYNVLRARTGSEALEVSARHAGPIKLLLTDLIMPQMGGEALATRFLQSRPDARVLYMTGYSPQLVESPNDPVWLQKPLRAAELLMAVRGVLDTETV
jgi:two-component system cell cycle sensor histidine kinase/response regulator CckA